MDATRQCNGVYNSTKAEVEDDGNTECFDIARVSQSLAYPCLHELFEVQASLRGDAAALVCGNMRLSYSELDIAANQLAHYLRAHGACKGRLIGIFLERSHLPVVAILACLKAGAAYVPLDPSFPDERLAYIAGEAEIALLLTQDVLKDRASQFFGGVTLSLDSSKTVIENQPQKRLSRDETGVSCDDICYVLYTSGTTGRPKGVVTLHRNVAHFVQAFNSVCITTPQDRIYQGFALTFDGSVEEIWMAFSNGAALVVGTKSTPRFGNDLACFLTAQGVTYFSTVPTMLSTITEPVPCLRQLVVSGEACPQELVTRWAGNGLRMLNVYGPTECTVNTTAAICEPGKPVTIGQPLDGYSITILDPEGQPVKDGETGELYIGGVTLASGYLKQPELTKRAFVQNGDERLYRTGDLVRLNVDGEIEFFGRIDSQVKIRGFRVELSEIESVLLEQEEVSNAVVTLYEREGVPSLAAYVTLSVPTASFDRAKILQILRARLPSYMVPAFLDVLDSFPLLTSGKADKRNLPAPSSPLASGTGEIEKPKTELERSIARAWQITLKVPEVGAEQDFFLDLGGHSLLAAKLTALLRQEADIHIPVRDIYAFPTVRKLAQHVMEQRASKSDLPLPPSQPDPAPAVRRKPGAILITAQIASMLLILFLLSSPLALVIPVIEDTFYGKTSTAYALVYIAAILFALWPVMLLFSIGAKWAIIGRYKAGRYPLWGSYYFRWWLVSRLQGLGAGLFAVGTPLMPVYYRLMGAKVGRNCALDTALCSAWDLISIGDDTSIGADTQLLGTRIEDGYLIFGKVEIGSRCFIGLHSSLGLNVAMGDEAKLDDQSLLQDGERIPAKESRRGSPARPAEIKVPAGLPRQHSRLRLALFGTAQIVAGSAFGLILGLPAIALLIGLCYILLTHGIASTIILIFLSVPFLIVFSCLWIAFCKRLVLPRAKPGVYELHTLDDLRFWLSAGLMRGARTAMLPVFTTLYLPPWMRLLGAKIGKYSEMSTIFSFLPELLSAGDGSFFADGSILGGRRTNRGQFEVGLNSVGDRSFVGNSAMLPPGASLGNRCLLGVLSTPPDPAEPAPDETDWLGSPGFRLPNRQKVGGFVDAVTYVPTNKLYFQRAVVDACRILIPAYTGIVTGFAGIVALFTIYKACGMWVMIGLIPALALLLAAIPVAITVGLKWAIMGRFKPVIVPLWSPYVWLNEMINGIYESVMAPIVSFFFGTPVAPMLLRLLGCKIGRHCFINTALFSEFDLVRVGNGVSLNFGAIIQNHLFEDRIMKSSYLDIEDGCSVGNMSVVLYDSRMEQGSVLGPMSLLMKAEVMPAGSRWHGIPTVQG
jgi:non-ribosomal peptide synthetase-like protein